MQEAVQLIKDGAIGEVHHARTHYFSARGSIGAGERADVPPHINYEDWQGPAPRLPFVNNYLHYNWHWFWKTGNGDLNNQGTHQLDVARWAIDDDQTHPVRAMAIGGRFAWHDQGETPNTMFAMAEYPNGQMVLFNVRNVNYEGYRHQVCNEYYLEDGSVITGEGTYKIRRPGSETAEDLPLPPGTVTPGGEWASFIAAVRAGDPALANGGILDAHYGCVLGHLMNNSYRLGTEVPFDAKAASFGDDREVAAHFEKLHAIMQDGVGVPADATSYRLGPWLSFDAETERFTGERAAEANQLLEDPHTAAFQVPKPDDV